MKIKIKSIVLVLSLIVGVFRLPAFANSVEYLPLEGYGLDTIAGYSTVLRTSKTAPNSKIVFEVGKPNGEIVKIDAVSSGNGVVITDFSDYYTKMAGIYTVKAGLAGQGNKLRSNTFTVYPGKISIVKSKITPKDQVVRSAGEKASFTVKLVDDYGNPVEGHSVKLISSAYGDQIEAMNNLNISDKNGEVAFKVSPSETGTVTYSVYDTTADSVLDARAKVVYFQSNKDIFGYAGSAGSVKKAAYDFGSLPYGSPAGPINGFKFEDIPATIYAGENVSLEVIAHDALEQVITNYTGTIRFSSQGDNANYVILPNDYTFTADDQGSHTFSLGFLFAEAGNYEIKVTHLADTDVYTEESFTVIENISSGSDSTMLNALRITNPSPGTYSSNVQVITGTAPTGSKLKIFDNNIQIISLIAGTDGGFSYTTGALLDGAHQIYVATVNDVGTIITTSPAIEFVIDTAAAEISQVLIEPDDHVDAGVEITVKLYVEDELSEAKLILNGNVYQLEESDSGYYRVNLAAPIEFGDYNLDFVLSDELGNESDFDAQAKLTVGPSSASGPGDGEDGYPGDIESLVATPGDMKVTLNWVAPAVSSDSIENYRVYYGTSPNQLTEAIDTFTDATTWYIPNLQNGIEYYFGVIAVDEMSNTSKGFNKIVSAIPIPAIANVISPDVLNGSGGSDAISEMEKDASESGPEVLWLILVSAIGGLFYSAMVRRRFQK